MTATGRVAAIPPPRARGGAMMKQTDDGVDPVS